MMRRVALATATTAHALDEDMPPLIEALRVEGIAGEPATWSDPVDWADFPLVVIRSTWDYARRRDEFVAWADRIAAVTTLANSASVIRWNTDKRYLRELARAGISVAPTHWIEPSDRIEWPFDGEIVVKPAVSAGAIDTARHASRDAAVEHVRRLQSMGRTAMVQPYLTRLDDLGETGLIFIDGRFSHAIRKSPILRGESKLVEGLYVQEQISPRVPDAAERELAERALALAPEPLLYARIDLAPGPGGGPVLLEFEATEPSLFFGLAPESAPRFARAISRRLR